MSIIDIKNLEFAYKSNENFASPVLSNISFSVEKGEFVALVGKNGSGKSTLSKLLNGLLLPTRGTVLVGGHDTKNDSTIFEVRKTAGIVFQNPDNQMVASIIEDDIAFGPENIGVPREEIVKRVDWALETVGMQDYRHGTASKLSGGQKQRIAIASTLAMKPEVLIFDEATSMLDPKGRQEVLSVAEKLNNQGITVIFITHNMDEVSKSKRTIVLQNGQISFDGNPRELFSKPEIIKNAGLDLPPVAKLNELLRKKGIELSKEILFEDEIVDEICTQLK